MSDVKRYWAFGFVDDETGEDSTEQVLVVLASDYDALRAEVERLRGLLREAYHDVGTCHHNAIDSREALMCDHYSDLIARIDAALAGDKP